MQHQFHLKIDPVTMTGQVLLDQRPLSAQSPLSVCGTHSFFDWYRDLPDLMFSEINDDYTLCIEGPDLPAAMLHAVFRTATECLSRTHLPRALCYSMEQRYTWLKEAAASVNVQLPPIPRFCLQYGPNAPSSAPCTMGQLPAFYQKFCSAAPAQITIWLGLPQGQPSAHDMVLCCGPGEDLILPTGTPQFFRDIRTWPSLITQWLDRMLLAPYLFRCQALLSPHLPRMAFDAAARVRMLSRDEPWVRLHLPARVEVGNTCPIQLEEFPASNLNLSFSNRGVLDLRGTGLYALRPGTTSVAVISESGAELCRKNVQVYRVNRVQGISLHVPHSDILLNETFAVTANCTPAGAENLSKATWTTNPSGILTSLGQGRFRAEAPGRCTVCLTIEAVSQQIDLVVHPAPTSIQLPAEIQVKLNHAPYPYQEVLQPTGSRCQMVRYRIKDPSVAEWDSNLKAVRPLAEGRTELEVSAIGAGGQCLFVRTCPVTILPEKDIITPPPLLTLAVCSTILFLLTYSVGNSAYLFLVLLSIGFAVASVAWGLTRWIHRQASNGEKISVFLSLMLAVLCAFFL